MDKSIFNLIKQAIITHSSKDVTIHERPLATELIESEKKDYFSPYDFLPPSYLGKKLILTRYLIYIGRVVILFIIAVIYAIYDLLHRIVTGEWKSEVCTPKKRDGIIEEKDEKENENEEKKENRWKKWLQLHPIRLRRIRSSSGLNSLILVFVLTISVLMLVFGFHFLIKEVVLPDNNSRINSYGVVSIDQGCLEEQHFFLLNSATFWTNTGIAVTEGDEVYITASGSMYSDIDDMSNAAKDNRKTLYSRSNFLCKYDTIEPDAEYCIYGRFRNDRHIPGNKPAYGSLLYQICDEIQGPRPYNTETDSIAVKQINFAKYKEDNRIDKRYRFKADKSGLFYFTFNDILLDDQMIDLIMSKTSETRESLIDIYTKYYDKSSLDTVKWVKTNVDSLIWFEDNYGEALINVRIEKKISNTHIDWRQKILLRYYRLLRSLYTETEQGFWYDFFHSGLLVLMLIVLGWFTLDVFVSNRLNRAKKSDENKKANENKEDNDNN